MKLQEERKLLVFVYIEQNGLNSLDSLRNELEMKEDPDFSFENTLDVLVKDNCLEMNDDLSWKITEIGNTIFRDLKLEKYEDLNKLSYLVRLILVIIAILAFMKIFPKMFPQF